MILCATPAVTPLSCIRSVFDASLMLIFETMTLTGPGLLCGLLSGDASVLGGLASTPDTPAPRQHTDIPRIPLQRAVFMDFPPPKDELTKTIRLRREKSINASNRIRRSVSKKGR